MTSPSRRLPDWLRAYLVYTYPTAPPEVFHKWSAITAVAGALQRRVWVQYDEFSLYPNMYNILIGPPGSMKSTAMRIGQKMLMTLPGFNYSVDSISREKLIDDIKASSKNGQSALTVYCSEFSSFFSTSGPEMAVFLTDIYESPDVWVHRTKTQQISQVNNACLNLMACTQPETMAKSLPLHSVGMGLTSRIPFIFADTPRERDWRGNKDQEQIDMRDHLLNDLKVISTLAGEMNFAPDADKAYNEWYKPFQQNLPSATNDERLRPYFSRKHTHLMKVCMVLSAMRRDTLVMTMEDLTDAHSLLDEIESRMSLAFLGFGGSITANPMAKITEVLYYKATWMELAELLDIMKRDVRRMEFDECLATLIATNAVEETIQGGKRYYRTTAAFNSKLGGSD